MHDYIYPQNYNLSHITNEIINGSGFFVLKKAFSKEDVEAAKRIVDRLTREQHVFWNTDHSQSGTHNSHPGVILKVLGNGKIFEKVAQHPVILDITRTLLGSKSHISSFASHTVEPGMSGQLPHLDYPYYEGYFPEHEASIQRPLLGVAFMVMLSEFTELNGGTAFRPGSQKRPTYPRDVEDFYRNMVQLQGNFIVFTNPFSNLSV